MPPHTVPTRMRRARVPVIWLLVLALMAYGCSSVLVQVLGPAHRHAAAVQTAGPGWLGQAGAVLQQVQGWRAELRARWLPAEQLPFFRHGEGHRHGHADADAHAHPHAGAQADPHAHAHATYQRHHHDPHDATVMALDGNDAAPMTDAASAAGAGSATLPLGLAAPWTAPAAAQAVARWSVPVSARWTDAATSPPEHPPRA